MLIEIEKLLNGGSHSFTLKENVQISIWVLHVRHIGLEKGRK